MANEMFHGVVLPTELRDRFTGELENDLPALETCPPLEAVCGAMTPANRAIIIEGHNAFTPDDGEFPEDRSVCFTCSIDLLSRIPAA